MVLWCVLRHCPHFKSRPDEDKREGFRCHRFPVDPQQFKLWEDWVLRKHVVGRTKISKWSGLCSAHFTENMYRPYSTRLKDSAVPSLAPRWTADLAFKMGMVPRLEDFHDEDFNDALDTANETASSTTVADGVSLPEAHDSNVREEGDGKENVNPLFVEGMYVDISPEQGNEEQEMSALEGTNSSSEGSSDSDSAMGLASTSRTPTSATDPDTPQVEGSCKRRKRIAFLGDITPSKLSTPRSAAKGLQMVRSCAIIGCKSKELRNVMKFCFPREVERYAKWIAFVNRPKWQPRSNSRICELHFAEDQWERLRVDGSKKLKCSAVPTLLACEEEETQPISHNGYIDVHSYCRPCTTPSKTYSSADQPRSATAFKNIEASKSLLQPQTHLSQRNPFKDLTANQQKSAHTTKTGSFGVGWHQVVHNPTINSAISVSAQEIPANRIISIKAEGIDNELCSHSQTEPPVILQKNVQETLPSTGKSSNEETQRLKEQLKSTEKELAELLSKHDMMHKEVGRLYRRYIYMKKQNNSLRKKLKKFEDYHYWTKNDCCDTKLC